MSLAVSDIHNPEIDSLVQSSFDDGWIPCSEITGIRPSQVDDAVYYAIRKYEIYSGKMSEMMIMLLLLGSSEECTPTLVSEFARIYSLPKHKYNNDDVNYFRGYSTRLEYRNKLIKGFTKYDNKYYMVADRLFYHCYSRYGFCTICGILRCSPVWCICGHKQLSDGWTSDNEQLDEFIKKSQLQTNSPNHAYLEWIPFDCISIGVGKDNSYLPTDYRTPVKLIKLEITDETHDLYYAEVNYLLMRHVY